jgi:hypothetical protein
MFEGLRRIALPFTMAASLYSTSLASEDVPSKDSYLVKDNSYIQNQALDKDNFINNH